jgi:hypothetical protein
VSFFSELGRRHLFSEQVLGLPEHWREFGWPEFCRERSGGGPECG